MNKHKWQKVISTAVVLALVAELLIAFLPPQQATIKSNGRLSLETPITVSVGAKEVYASPAEITIDAEFSVVCIAGTSWNSGYISSGQYRDDSYRTGIDFDTSAIPDGSTITKVELKLYIDEEATPLNNDVAKMTSKAKTYYDANNYSGFNTDVDGNEYLSNSAGYAGTGSHTVELLDAAETDLENQLSADWFSVGWTGTTEADNKYRDGHTYLEDNPPQLIVTYTLPWASYSDSGHSTACDYFDDYPSENIIYMYGTGFDADTTYRVVFWDWVDPNWVNRETEDPTADGSGNLSAAHTLLEGTDTDGNWHCTVYDSTSYSPTTYDPDDSHLVADDTSYTGDVAFYVANTAIPEFPTVMAAIAVAGLCFGIYYWMRKRRVLSSAKP